MAPNHIEPILRYHFGNFVHKGLKLQLFTYGFVPVC